MIWLAALAIPFLLGWLMLVRPATDFAVKYLAPVAALPALALALKWGRGYETDLPWIFLGARFGLDQAGEVFLLFTAFLWTVAVLYSRTYMPAGDPNRDRFYFFFLLSMTGNLGLIMSRDVAGFYAFFALMTFAGYGLVVHNQTREALRAARIYLIMAVLGEAMLVGAIYLVVSEANSILLNEFGRAVAQAESRDWIIFLAFAGFGIKAGVLLLHFWLPLAHPEAPTPASAVLSGAMIKAGLFAWLYFLPLGEGSFPGWGLILIVAGLSAAFYGVAIGLTQDNPKTQLAYSSISQMGGMTVAVGIGLAQAEAWPAALTAVLLFALNHSLGKGALFLGVGIAGATGRAAYASKWIMGALGFVALVIGGLPATGGGIAKHSLKQAAELGPAEWSAWLGWLLPLTAVGTTLLLSRFLWTTWTKMKDQSETPPAGIWVPWAVLIAAVAVAIFWISPVYRLDTKTIPQSLPEIVAGIWPIVAGAGLYLAGSILIGSKRLELPAGDLVVHLERGARRGKIFWFRWIAPDPSKWQLNLVQYVDRFVENESKQKVVNKLEVILSRWETAGLAFVLLILLLSFFLMGLA
jgi:formate hydrogenlyase subunit 3/multisubunit Na+/H+ antiporter MnhD subunit